MKKKFEVFWTQFHKAGVFAENEEDAKTIALNMDAAETLVVIQPMVLKQEVNE